MKKENIINEFENFINSIPKETYKKEQLKWKDIPGYDIGQIEEFLDYRLKYIDDLMETKKEVKEETTETKETEEQNEEQVTFKHYNKEKVYENMLYAFIIIVIICTILIYLKNN